MEWWLPAIGQLNSFRTKEPYLGSIVHKVAGREYSSARPNPTGVKPHWSKVTRDHMWIPDYDPIAEYHWWILIHIIKTKKGYNIEI